MTENNFFIVPNSIFGMGLDSKAIVVYCCLLRHAGKKKECFPGRKTIAEECGIGVTTVDRALKKLCSAGLIIKQNRVNSIGGKTSNKYYCRDF